MTEQLVNGYNRRHMNALNSLNQQQITAVTADTGATLVLAGPGSGKTRVLTHRIAYLIRDLGVRPYNILAVTFTNKAASEMKKRLVNMLDDKADGVWLGTFHSICARILRREAQYLPVDGNFVIYDVDDQVALIKSIIKKMDLDDKLYRAGSVLTTISWAKNEMIVPVDYLANIPRDYIIHEIYQEYDKKLLTSINDKLKTRIELIKSICLEKELDDRLYKPKSILSTIQSAKNSKILPDNYLEKTASDEVIQTIYESYEKGLRTSNAVDFDDLLLLAIHLLHNFPEVRERYAQRFEYVLVDEFQDTNQIQYELVKAFASFHNNLFVVGDEDQSIYRWRGADYRNVLRFEEDNEHSQKILLEENYRSTQVILDVARAVIDRNRYRTPKALFTQRGSGKPVHFYNADDDRDEADYVVRTIQTQMRKGIQGGAFAVMYRTNAQSRVLEEAFMKAGIPYRLVGAQRFYGRREVKDVIAYLRLVHNPKDEISLRRVINVPTRKIGKKTVETLVEVAGLAESSMGEVLLELAVRGEESEYWAVLGRSARAVWSFGRLLAGWIAVAQTFPLPDLFDRILLDIEYQDYIGEGSEDEVIDRWGNVQELRRQAIEYNDTGMNAFLEKLALVSDQDTIPEKADSPTLLTLHAAKGLEFDQVFIIGLDEGILPHVRSLEDEEDLAEERRLFYVGITRACNQLYLVRVQRRYNFGKREYENQLPSRFFNDVPANLVIEDSNSGLSSFGGGRRSRRERPNNRWENTKEESYFDDWDDFVEESNPREVYTWERIKAQRDKRETGGNGYAALVPQKSDAQPKIIKTEATYKPGMQVKHSVFGEGLVLNVVLEGDGEETVEIFFAGIKEKKKLAASFAKLEII